MREIKFRGKRICDGLWLYGNLIQSNAGNVTINGTNKYCRVDPKTVGQYTGLHDKNGKEIYEGDIVKYYGEKYEVSYYDKYCMFHLKHLSDVDDFSVLDCDDKSLLEVVGNIYSTKLEELK